MANQKTRSYHSVTREQQASETRRRITEAARVLFIEKGYDFTTITEIAARAGVAVPTVYSVFGSKLEIVKEIVTQVRFSPFMEEFAKRTRMNLRPLDRIKLIANFVRNVNEAGSTVNQLLKVGRISEPDIVAIEKERSLSRYHSQKLGIQSLQAQEALKSDLSFDMARDILWSLTSPDIYHLLVTERHWTPSQFEKWLAETLADQLLSAKFRR